MTGYLVEPPGTAPGSEPLITQGFITIVPKNTHKISPRGANEKADGEKISSACLWFCRRCAVAAYRLRRRSEMVAAIWRYALFNSVAFSAGKEKSGVEAQ